jgi:hypothetical protein
MNNEQVAPETRGVAVKVLATVDLAREIESPAGRQLRMRKVTIEPGGVLGPIHDQASSTSCRERSLTIGTGSLRTMGPEWAGPRIATRPTGSRTGERLRPWRSLSTSSLRSELTHRVRPCESPAAYASRSRHRLDGACDPGTARPSPPTPPTRSSPGRSLRTGIGPATGTVTEGLTWPVAMRLSGRPTRWCSSAPRVTLPAR